jgi:hypothetical protein
MCKINDKIRIEKQFISSQAFHRTPYGRVRETAVWERLELENLKIFDLVAEEQHRLPPARIITPSKTTKSTNGSRLTKRTKNGSVAKKKCARKNLILREWESTPRLQSTVESRQGTSRLKGWWEKLILGDRTKTAEENHWPKNKAGENDWCDASRQHGNRPEQEMRIRPTGLPSEENLTMKKRKGGAKIQDRQDLP